MMLVLLVTVVAGPLRQSSGTESPAPPAPPPHRSPALVAAGPADLAARYAGAIRKINETHARRPGKRREEELAKALPRGALRCLEELIALPAGTDGAEALLACGEAALELDRMEDFAQVRGRLLETAPDLARRLGVALSRPRVQIRGLGGLDHGYLEGFAVVFEAILAGYDELFGFAEWSKVPGKKLRVRLHLEEKITRPPHFAPQYPFHSEIDFPVVDGQALRSPTAQGQFLFYGLCHELGHVIAMWGDRRNEEDHHAWAHYTGVLLVEHLTRKLRDRPFMRGLRDHRWRSLTKLRGELKETEPSLQSREGVLAMLLALHDAAGSRAIGKALNLLDAGNKARRIHRVRYYRFAQLRDALLVTLKKQKRRRMAVRQIFAAAGMR
ncbi:MAG: hypothetical protein ACE5GW_01005 [Planctomycetota bacterium]